MVPDESVMSSGRGSRTQCSETCLDDDDNDGLSFCLPKTVEGQNIFTETFLDLDLGTTGSLDSLYQRSESWGH